MSVPANNVSPAPHVFHDTLSATPEEVAAMRHAIDLRQRKMAGSNRRSHARVPLHAARVKLTVIHPGGSVGRFLLHPVNISSGGMCVLHGGFLHPGSRATLEVQVADAPPLIVTGHVAWCVHERQRSHVLGIRFDSPVNIRPLVDPSLLKTSLAEAQVEDPQSLCGRVIAIEDQPIERELLYATLADTAIDLTFARDANAVLELANKEPIDLILCDLNLGTERGEEVIARLRASAFSRPIVVVTADSNPVRLTGARSAGANEFITKPYEPTLLLRVIADLLAASGITVTNKPLVTTLDRAAAEKRRLPEFIRHAKETAVTIQQAIESDKIEQALSACFALRSTSLAYGFPLLHEAASRGATAITASQSIAESRDELLRVIMVANRLAAA